MIDPVEAAAAAALVSASDDAAPAASASDESAPHPLHAEIEAWFASHFHNSIVARDTETFNHVRAAVDDLKVRLAPDTSRPKVGAAVT
jgi:hypothetical protein